MIDSGTSPATARGSAKDKAPLGLRPRIAAYQERAGSRIHAWARARIGPISHVVTKDSVAALTFDDGPNPEFTPPLLQVLAKHGARATFFMLGTMARRHPDIVREAAQQGHAIGNHTWDHRSIPLISRAERWRQIRSCSRALAPHEQKLFRPPYGQRDLGSCVDAALWGYTIVAWNMHAFDWLDHDGEWMANHMISVIRPGSIIALHDALYHVMDEKYADRSPTVRAVDLLLERIGHQYQFVTVPELLRHGFAERQNCYGPLNRDALRVLKPNDGPVHVYTTD